MLNGPIWFVEGLKIICHVRPICSTTICHPPLSKTTPSFTSSGCPAQPWAGPMGCSRGRTSGRYIGWMLIGWLTFTTASYGMGQGKGGGKWVWAIRFVKEGIRVNGWVLKEMSLKGEVKQLDWQLQTAALSVCQDTLLLGYGLTSFLFLDLWLLSVAWRSAEVAPSHRTVWFYRLTVSEVKISNKFSFKVE